MAEEMLNNILDWCFDNTNILHFKKSVVHYISEQGYTQVVAKILSKKVDVNLKDNLGETPLHLASRNGHSELAKLLLEKGADTNCQSNSNQSQRIVGC